MDSEARRDAAMAARFTSGTSAFPSIPGIVPPVVPPAASAAAAKSVSGIRNIRKELETEVKKQNALVRLTERVGLSEGLAAQILGGSKPLKTAAKIVQGTQKAADKLQAIFNKTAAGKAEVAQAEAAANQAASQAAAQLSEEQAAIIRVQNDNARLERAALEERQKAYQEFSDSIARTFSGIKDQILGAFTLPQLGGSTNAIIRNMDKLLARVKAFSQNITKLSSMGLDPKLLQQVINAGPIAGAKLAANLVAGGVGGLSAINAGYSALGSAVGEIATTGTQLIYGGQPQQNVFNVNVEGGLDSPASIGKAVVDAIKAYERTSGAVFQGA
jgi:molecular chaperone GrpE (heat shock protein)